MRIALARCPPELADARCPECRRLLFRGVMVGEIMCPRCSTLVKFGAAVAYSITK